MYLIYYLFIIYLQLLFNNVLTTPVYHYSINEYELLNANIHFDINYVSVLYNRIECERWNEPDFIQLYNKTIVLKNNPNDIESLSYIYIDNKRNHILLYIDTPYLNNVNVYNIQDCNITYELTKHINGCYYYQYEYIIKEYKNEVISILNKLIINYPNYKLVFFGKTPILYLIALELKLNYDIYVDYLYSFYFDQQIGNKVLEKIIDNSIHYKYKIIQDKDIIKHLYKKQYQYKKQLNINYKTMNVNIQYDSSFKICGYDNIICVNKLYNLTKTCNF